MPVKNFIRLKELPFSVAADDKLASVNLYMRERDRVPMAAVIAGTACCTGAGSRRC